MEAKELFQKGQHLFIQGMLKESVQAFTEAMAKGSDPAITLTSRGAAYLRLGEHVKAVEDFSRVIAKDMRNARAYYFRGVACLNLGEFERAAKDLTRSLELKPENGAAYFARGTCYAQMDRDDEAARDLKTALSFSEASVQGFADAMGIIRTQFDKALALMTGERRAPTVSLTEEETEKLRKWLEGAEA